MPTELAGRRGWDIAACKPQSGGVGVSRRRKRRLVPKKKLGQEVIVPRGHLDLSICRPSLLPSRGEPAARGVAPVQER